MKNGILLDEKMLKYDFGNNHVMSTQRIFAAYHLMNELYLQSQLNDFSDIQAIEYDKSHLRLAHDESYIQKLEELSRLGNGIAMEYGLGTPDCPVWKGMAEVSEFVVSSSLTMADKIYQDELSYGFVLLGGLHHAARSEASGFCYYNDVNVVIHRLQKLDPEIRILYLDTDLHHGDGVQDEFYTDPNVLTISFHESGRFLFPGTGFPDEIGSGQGEGSSVNLPFYPYTWDEEYQQSFSKIFPSLFESFQPDYVIWQAGSDAHMKDPLGHMMLTSGTYRYIGEQVRSQAIKEMNTPKVLTFGGGGYNPYANAKSWTNALAGLTNTDLPSTASQDWVNKCQEFGITVQRDIHDIASSPIGEDKDTIITANQNYMDDLKRHISEFYSI